MSKKWTEEDRLKLEEMYKNKIDIETIAIELCRTTTAIKNAASKFGIAQKHPQNVPEDLTGKYFGRWHVLERADDHISVNGNRTIMWKCQCSCENQTIKIVYGNHLKNGTSKSCGCLQKEILAEINKQTKIKINRYDLETYDYGVGWTSNTNELFYFDKEDYEIIKDYCWGVYVDNTGYRLLYTHNKNDNYRIMTMAQLLTNCNNIDHKNRNPLDNRKMNLRVATSYQQARNRSIYKNNTSGFMGVYYMKNDGQWMAEIRVNYQSIYLGKYVHKEDALVARLKAELKYFGKDFAPQRHLFEKYGVADDE